MTNGSTRAWRTLRAQVIAEEPLCRIRGEGCTRISDSVDHILPLSTHPHLRMVRANLRGSCQHCNYKRGAGPIQPAPKQARALSFFATPKQARAQ
jgi:5-methylcytosine-specific restriction endonuclease McrA